MKPRLTRAALRAQGRAIERADTLAAIATIRAGLTNMVAAGKLDGDGAAMLDRRLEALADQIAQGLHEKGEHTDDHRP